MAAAPLRWLGRGAFGQVAHVGDSHTVIKVFEPMLVGEGAADGEDEVLAAGSMHSSGGTRVFEGVPAHALREVAATMMLHQGPVPTRRILRPMFTTWVKGKFCTGMRHMQCNLRQALWGRTVPLREAEVRNVMGQVLEALVRAHARGVVHRDVKPANILLTDVGDLNRLEKAKVVLADWGLARITPITRPEDHRSILNSMAGGSDRPPPTLGGRSGQAKSFASDTAMTSTVQTLWYRAPEVLFGEGWYTARCDVWSVGVILGEMVHWRTLVTPTPSAFQPKTLLDVGATYHVDNEDSAIRRIFRQLGAPTQHHLPHLRCSLATRNTADPPHTARLDPWSLKATCSRALGRTHVWARALLCMDAAQRPTAARALHMLRTKDV